MATPEVRFLTRLIVVAASLVLVTGTAVTGAGPHGGDEDVERLALFVPDVARVHSIGVWVLLAVTLWTLAMVRRGGGGPGVERMLRVLIVLEVGQGAIGYLQYFTGVPEGLVLAHVAGSMLVLGAAVLVTLSTTVVEVTSTERARRTSPVASGV